MTGDRPHVRADPAQRFGLPNVQGVPVHTITDLIWAGETPQAVANDYTVTRADVLVACWYQARHGTRRWRLRWRQWLLANEPAMWHGNWDQVAIPPSKDG